MRPVHGNEIQPERWTEPKYAGVNAKNGPGQEGATWRKTILAIAVDSLVEGIGSDRRLRQPQKLKCACSVVFPL